MQTTYNNHAMAIIHQSAQGTILYDNEVDRFLALVDGDCLAVGYLDDCCNALELSKLETAQAFYNADKAIYGDTFDHAAAVEEAHRCYGSEIANAIDSANN